MRRSRSRSRTAAQSSTTASVPDWLSDLVPDGSNQLSPLGARAMPQVAATPMEIPLALTSLLTSDNSAALSRIRAASNAEIAIRQDMQHLGYSLAIITGTAQATSIARCMIMQQIGLAAGGGNITKEVEVPGDMRMAIGIVDTALAELRIQASGVQIAAIPPRRLGERGVVVIGPGPVAHVAVAETLVRKKLTDAELEVCYRQGRPVLAALKIPVPCRFFDAGDCSQGGRCQYSHGASLKSWRWRKGSLDRGLACKLLKTRLFRLPTRVLIPTHRGRRASSEILMCSVALLETWFLLL